MKNTGPVTALVTLFLFLFLNILSGSVLAIPKAQDSAGKARIVENYGKLPLSFEKNQGQTDEKVAFLSRGSGYTLFLAPDEAVLSLSSSSKDEGLGKKQKGGSKVSRTEKQEAKGGVIRMKLSGANPSPVISGEERLSGTSNYFIGNDPSKWPTRIPKYEKIRYREVYLGIDLIFYGNQRRLEYDFVVSPGSDPSKIRLEFQGAEKISLDEKGNLVLRLKDGEVIQQAPVIYQEVYGKRIDIAGEYLIDPTGRVGCQVASYDRNLPLIIDPVLEYSTYLGGSNWEWGYAIAVDSLGNAYVTGWTASHDFPTINARFSDQGYIDGFIFKLSPDGSQAIYSTYLGGSGDDKGLDIAIDSSGNAYVTGGTDSDNFPTVNALYPDQGGRDAFIFKLSPDGSKAIYSTYLGGSDYDNGRGMAVDSSGNAYVTGQTSSSLDFPKVNALYPSYRGYYDAFIFKLSPDGSQAIYSTYLGGSDLEDGWDIAVDSSGNAYVTGETDSYNFPTVNALYPDQGGRDGFIFKLSPDGSKAIYSTYLGGSDLDRGFAIALDSQGNAYVTGHTASHDFPTVNARYPDQGGSDAFIFKLSPNGGQAVYSTYLGGSDYDNGIAIALDSQGNAYVTGSTLSDNFPTVNSLYANYGGGLFDAFIFKLSPNGGQAVYSTYLGGSDYDIGYGIAVDSSGNAYVAGATLSDNFPTVNARYPDQGDRDVFIAKISDSGPVCEPIIITTYTTDLSNIYERVFKYDEVFRMHVVLRNTGTSSITVQPNEDIKFDFYSADDRSPITIQNYPDCDTASVEIKPGVTQAINFNCKITKNEASWKSSGFNFIGKKFEAEVYLTDSPEPKKRYAFYIDEFGIPEWLRNVRFVEPSLHLVPQGNEDPLVLLNHYGKVAQRAKDLGFSALAFPMEYHQFGYEESHQTGLGINYWFPASDENYTGANTYYSTPHYDLTKYFLPQADSLYEAKWLARNLIWLLVSELHANDLKIVGYMDPNGIYSPDPSEYEPEDKTVAHRESKKSAWGRLHLSSALSLQKLDYLETEYPFGLQNIDQLALEVCPSGPSKKGDANYDKGFEYSTIKNDITNYINTNGNANGLSNNDISWHYEMAKQTHFIGNELGYDFDIINADDTGRLVMKPGPAPYIDGPWTSLYRPGCPTDDFALYKKCDCEICEELRDQAGATEDGFALDSYANMLKHMRWQLKDPGCADKYDQGALMSGDYFVPSDVRWEENSKETYWKSVTASEDAVVSDQFYIWKGSFARWAYKTFNLGYRVLRTDLRRSFSKLAIPEMEFCFPIVGCITTPEQSVKESLPPGYDKRPGLITALMMATAWANRAHCDFNNNRDLDFNKDGDLDPATNGEISLFSGLDFDFEVWKNGLHDFPRVGNIVNYLLMRKKLDEAYPNQVPIPLFREREAQELLYNQRFLNYPNGNVDEVNIEGEYEYLDGRICNPTGSDYAEEPYTILYSLPGEYGEKGRILHIMNERVISNDSSSEVDVSSGEIPADYCFKIKIPNGHKVNSIYLVSPDFYNDQIDPDRDGNPDPDFYADITGDEGYGKKWYVEGNQLVVIVPHVIAYTAVLIEFESDECADYKSIAKAFLPNIYQTNFDIVGGDNNIILVGYNVLSYDIDTATVAYHIVFADEDCPPNFLENFIDYDTARICSLYYTSHLPFPLYTGRLADIETFYVTGNINTGDIVRLEFPGINGKGSWAGNDVYDIVLPTHQVQTFEGSDLDEFRKPNGHLDLYVVTWNHEFFNKPRYYWENPDEFSLVVDGNFASFYPATRRELNRKYYVPCSGTTSVPQFPPATQYTGSCGASCQTTAPLTVAGSAMDVRFNYTALVEVMGGVMSEDFSTVWWLTDSCNFSTDFEQAASSKQFSCTNVTMPTGSEHGWVFWMVAPTATADFGDDEWWSTGVYELMWYQFP